MRDVRPSTVFHFLFSYGPSLLSSPHHLKRMKVEEYVSTLVKLDGSVDNGEDDSWMTTMTCCDSYQQRASSAGGNLDGDSRVPEILMILGQELMRRRRN
jgi:conserved oligomeric Golgi complex subunit 5